MVHVMADVEALRALRQALSSFADRQTGATRAAEYEIAAAIDALEGAEVRRRQAVNICQDALRDCQWHAAQAAQEGYGWDCSQEHYALQTAEERLERIFAWRRRVGEAEETYRIAVQDFLYHLEVSVDQATRFLDERIAALEAFHAARLPRTTAAASLGLDPTQLHILSPAELKGESVQAREARGELRAEQLEEPSEKVWAAQIMEAERRAADNPSVAGDPITGAPDPKTLGEAVGNIIDVASDVLRALREDE